MATRPRGGSFQTDFMVAGTRYRETFDTKDEGEAWELEARAAIKRGLPVPPTKNGKSDTGASLATLGPLWEHVKKTHYLNNPKITEPDTAIRNGEEVVKFFGPAALVSSIDVKEMKRLVQHVIDTGRSHNTADRKLAVVSKMLRIADEEGVLTKMPKVPRVGEANEEHRSLTKEEAHKILSLWREWEQPDLHAFTVFALHCGARLNRVLTLKWSHFSPAFNTVLLWGSSDKKSKTRTLPISKAARDAILYLRNKYPDSAGPFAHLSRFGTLRTMWDRMQKHLGPAFDDVTVHTLRHTCASWQVQAGVDIKRVQTWLGHRNIATTLIYAHLAPGNLDQTSDVLGDLLEAEKPKLRVVSNHED